LWVLCIGECTNTSVLFESALGLACLGARLKNKGFGFIKLFLGGLAGRKDLPATSNEGVKTGHRCTLYMRCVSYLGTMFKGGALREKYG
jgi:hypothetical protein